MPRKQKRFIQDIWIIAISILIAIMLSRSGTIDTLITAIGPFSYIAIILAGIFFVSAFTVAPSIALLLELSVGHPLVLVALLAGLGAMIGDYLIFKFVRARITDDIAYLLSYPEITRAKKIFKTRIPQWFVPFIGALIVASPFPDEIGLTLLGFSNISTKKFLALVFALDAIGIFVILYFAEHLF